MAAEGKPLERWTVQELKEALSARDLPLSVRTAFV